MLCGRPRVERNGGAALFFGNAPGIPPGGPALVDPDAKLHRHRYVARRTDGGPDDASEQVRLERHGGASPTAGHLAHRAAEVQVEVVHPAFTDEPASGLARVVGIHAVELETPGRLLR